MQNMTHGWWWWLRANNWRVFPVGWWRENNRNVGLVVKEKIAVWC